MRVIVCVGTRPEAIKLAPVVQQLRMADGLHCHLHLTGQHTDMALRALSQFGLAPDTLGYLPPADGSLNARFGSLVTQMDSMISDRKPDVVMVHGDTATACASALAGFNRQTSVAHVEAGLRTGNLHAPWPEEGYRRIIARVAGWHFAATPSARDNLLAEGIAPADILVTGNTVVDALLMTRDRIFSTPDLRDSLERWLGNITSRPRIVLVTLHRRENHGDGIDQICNALLRLSRTHPDTDFVLPVHPNPAVKGPITQNIGHLQNVRLIEAAEYTEFVYLMLRSDLILTDSGGIQEEAPSLRRPVLIMRDETERPEAVEAGFARLVGSDPDRIYAAVADALLTGTECPRIINPFGDGRAAARIVSALQGRKNAFDRDNSNTAQNSARISL